jgi:hypothetical protein
VRARRSRGRGGGRCPLKNPNKRIARIRRRAPPEPKKKRTGADVGVEVAVAAATLVDVPCWVGWEGEGEGEGGGRERMSEGVGRSGEKNQGRFLARAPPCARARQSPLTAARLGSSTTHIRQHRRRSRDQTGTARRRARREPPGRTGAQTASWLCGTRPVERRSGLCCLCVCVDHERMYIRKCVL